MTSSAILSVGGAQDVERDRVSVAEVTDGRIEGCNAAPEAARAHTCRREGSMIRLDGIDHVALAVRDIDDSVAWYQRVLGLERLHQEVWGDFPAVVGIGSTALALFPLPSEEADVRPGKRSLAIRHVAFRASAQAFLDAQRHLKDLGIEYRQEDHQIAHSIYLRDPNGHELEITTYEVAPREA
ncbi:MAG: VOC family protein [Gemmatimonadetes bacterium]|nr:VOC family protein [Gemmatimonadota bacterium]